MNETINHQLNHRTIRFFKEQPVDEEVVQEVLNVFQRTATSVGMQQTTIIRMKDKEKKEVIADIGQQDYIGEAPELFIFIADCHRNYQIARTKGLGEKPPAMDKYFQAVADTYLAAQNTANALESLGLGVNFIGNILNDSQRLIKLLELPQYTMPVLGLSFGHPDDNPELKPRIPVKYRVGVDSYPMYDNYLKELEDYDQEMTTYYDTRQNNKRSDSFSNQVLNYFDNNNLMRDKILLDIEKQGFVLFNEDNG